MKNILLILSFTIIQMMPTLGLSSNIDLSYTKLEEKNINFTEMDILYQSILGSSPKTIAPIFKNPYGFTTDQVSTSLTSQSMAQELLNQSTQNRFSQALSQLKTYFTQNIKNSVLSNLEAAPAIPTQTLSAIDALPKDFSPKQNHFRPKLSLGTGYLKPALFIGNPLNAGVDTNVSYHSKDKNLEAIISKKLSVFSKDMKLMITNMNLFSANNEKRVMFGVQYQF